MKHNTSDFAQKVIEIAKQNGSISEEMVMELAKQYKIPYKQWCSFGYFFFGYFFSWKEDST